MKPSLAERVIKTLKAKYFCHMTQNQNFHYIDIVEEVTDAYNHRIHRSIKMRPVDVTKEKESRVWDTLYKSSSREKPNDHSLPSTLEIGSGSIF